MKIPEPMFSLDERVAILRHYAETLQARVLAEEPRLYPKVLADFAAR